ncbi:hypothetical protein BV25DRAFT_1128487 [Artomyces pyxidatus]|uniref:Uncharacterized protein n=1 Tax=Artomyces pyxidatus TaxID=48021 RepID=A0ACB8SUE8_9AGAM|nr:hypothetical protein BV25DRAFT_1128487 [Artomyces pyxidatus]
MDGEMDLRPCVLSTLLCVAVLACFSSVVCRLYATHDSKRPLWRDLNPTTVCQAIDEGSLSPDPACGRQPEHRCKVYVVYLFPCQVFTHITAGLRSVGEVHCCSMALSPASKCAVLMKLLFSIKWSSISKQRLNL